MRRVCLAFSRKTGKKTCFAGNPRILRQTVLPAICSITKNNRGFFVCRLQQVRIDKLSCYKTKTILDFIISSRMSLIFECDVLRYEIHHCLQFSTTRLNRHDVYISISETNSVSNNYIQCNHQMQENINVNHV